jgi:hypothetical protein
MPETREPRTVIDAAEQAAAAGDYASAEQLLREAALLQEARLGPLHPDLANTLNNLGVVCEITDKPDDAELCYRRAYAIATAVLEPDHPFVATSRRNLSDFCEARGKPVELLTPPSVEAPEPKPLSRSVNLLHERPSHATSLLFAFVRSRSVAIAALGVSGLVFVLFIVTHSWFGSDRQAAVSRGGATQSPPVGPASVPPVGPAPTPRPLPVQPIPMPKEIPTNRGGPAGAGKSRASAAPAPGSSLTVADARLCMDLSTSNFRCDRPGASVRPGSLFFYTRIRSARDTTVQHRWYRGDHLLKAVELQIRANPTDGYRTYSRNTVGGGDWRVELRTRDGTLLHEERFVVRVR